MSMGCFKLRVGFVSACLLAALVACEGPTESPTASQDLQNIQADNVIFGMVSYLTAKGVRQGRIDADTAYVYNDSATVKLRVMKVVFYDEDGRERATVTAERGELEQSSDRMVARGNVVLTIPGQGEKVESAELKYDPDRQLIWSDSASVLTRADGSVTRGSSFQSDLQFNNVRIEKPRGAIGEIVH